MPFVDLEGVRFHYQQKGRGEDVVLIHAVTSNMAIWLFTNLLETLAEEFRVTAYDMRGHGASDVPATGYTSADMAQDLRKLHAALGLKPALLVGHSFGAVVAMHAAVLFPEMVRGLILCDPFFPGLAHLEPNLAEASVWKDVRDALVENGVHLPKEVNFTALFRMVAELSPEQRDRIRKNLDPTSWRWLSQLTQLTATTCGDDVFRVAGLTAERICQIRQPVIALYDEHTSFPATRRFLQEKLPNCRGDTAPGARHVAPLQNRAAFVHLVQKHLRALAAKA
jgi:pimeloyl-ACP methyl ester carboxylesterase